MDNKETKSDDMMDVEDMDWYKEQAAKDTPGRTLRFYRKLKGMTQAELAGILGTTAESINDFENDRKPISNTDKIEIILHILPPPYFLSKGILRSLMKSF